MAIRLTGLASGLDTDSMVQELVSAYSKKLESYEKKKTEIEWKQEKWSALNTKIYGFYTGALSSMRMSTSFAAKKTMTVSDPTKATVSAGTNVANGTQTIEIKNLAKASYLTSSVIKNAEGTDINAHTTAMSDLGLSSGSFTINVGGETKTVSFEETDKLSDFLAKIKDETGLAAAFDSKNQRIIINAESGKDNDFNFEINDKETYAALSKLGLTTEADLEKLAVTLGESLEDLKAEFGINEETKFAAKQNGEDAIIVVNGATFESASNSITVNGLTINATGVTNGAITVTAGSDTDGIYDMIKSFLTEYNTLINEMTKAYNADSAKGYQPLSDEEKDSMSEKEVEKWEGKIKDALLRRDDTLSGVLSTLTQIMQKGITIDGKNYNLSSFGIKTQSVLTAAENEQNAFHIDGDKKDSASADATDKLRAMIESDPDTVANFFNELAKEVYSTLTDKMKSTTLSSAYTIYNDKQLKEELKDAEDTIKDWEGRVADYEDKWYKQFAEMETALSKLQSQTSSLTALLGM